MKTSKKSSKKSPKTIVLETILDFMESDNSLPWDSGLLNDRFTPINYKTRKEYRGINRLLLNYLARRKVPGCTMEFASFKQIQEVVKDENVPAIRKGEHGFPILYFNFYDTARKCLRDKDSKDEDLIPLYRYSTVFSIQQAGLEIKTKRDIKKIPHTPNSEIDRLCTAFAQSTNLILDISKVDGTGFYDPAKHYVSLASLDFYSSTDAYYSTLFHELIHSTAAEMKRGTSGNVFGGVSYSEEEIVAECGSMLLCQVFGIKKETLNSSKYVQSWGSKLRENPDWLFKGMAAAEKAVDYFLIKSGYLTSEELA